MKNLKAKTTLIFLVLYVVSIYFVGCVNGSLQHTDESMEGREDLQLWYNQPARKWTEALPLGNGRLGAMVFGGTTQERIQLNEDTVWAGPPVPEDRVGAYKHIAKARKLIFEGKYSEAQRIMQSQVMGQRISPRSHQTLGDLRLQMPGESKTTTFTLSNWRRGGEDDTSTNKCLQVAYDDSGWAELVAKSGKFVKGNASVEPGKKAVFRSIFELTAKQLKDGLGHLELGPIDDQGIIYVNGKVAGRTMDYSKPHSFNVSKHLKAGKNVIAVVVGNVGGPGGMTPSVTLGPSTGMGLSESYKRKLDLDTGIATTTFIKDGISYKREVFASAVDQVIVVRMTADKQGSINIDAALDRPADFELKGTEPHTLAMTGQVSQNDKHKGVKYHTQLRAKPQGGQLEIKDKAISIINADAVTLLLVATTDYNFDDPYKPLTRDLARVCARQLAAVEKKNYERIRAEHIAEHRNLFSRVSLDIGRTPAASKPTDERLKALREGVDDPALAALYFQFGRYLLISCSRPGCMPSNLQGLWNEHTAAPWNADYHININIQMNYWPAEVCNLSECHEPFFRLTEVLVPSGRKTAKDVYNCRGFVAHHTTDVWWHTSPFGSVGY
ncbi:MAG: glycoside hydrolase family 95 protein, partial [Planctomycetota bacterium]